MAVLLMHVPSCTEALLKLALLNTHQKHLEKSIDVETSTPVPLSLPELTSR